MAGYRPELGTETKPVGKALYELMKSLGVTHDGKPLTEGQCVAECTKVMTVVLLNIVQEGVQYESIADMQRGLLERWTTQEES